MLNHGPPGPVESTIPARKRVTGPGGPTAVGARAGPRGRGQDCAGPIPRIDRTVCPAIEGFSFSRRTEYLYQSFP